jgi:hypothetical protein
MAAARALFGLVALTALVTVTSGLSSGTAVAAQAGHPGSLPHRGSVSRGRYVTTVRLDRGALTVTPASATDRPKVSEADAMTEFTADAQLIGYHRVVFGFGQATVTRRGRGVAPIAHLRAWVGFAQTSGLYHCPNLAGSKTPPGPPPPSNGYAAVVIGSAHGAPAVTYVAGSERCDADVPASVTAASETISIPWVAAGPLDNGSIEAEANVPPCGTFSSISSGGTASSITITLAAIVPDRRRHCSGPSPVTEKVMVDPPASPGAPPPLVTARTTIRHGRVGPVAVVQPS